MRQPIRVLVLEDEASDFELIERALAKAGLKAKATRVETEAEFARQLKEIRPDVVLSDHGLPQFDGIAALKMVKRKSPDTPFIFVAGAMGEETVIESFELGANDYVLKTRLEDLGFVITRTLEAKQNRPSALIASGNLASPELFQCAVEQAKEAVVITTAELDLPGPKILYVNEAFTQMTGYDAAEVIGETPRILQGRNTDRKVLDRLREQLAKGETFEGETFNYRKNGEEFILQWEISPLRNSSGVITHFVSVQRDVTDQRKLERERLSHERERARREGEEAQARLVSELLNRVTDAFVSLDRNWCYTFVNDKAGQIFGRKPEDLIGKHIWTEFPEGVGQPFHKAYVKAMAEQKPLTIEEFYEPWQKWFENRIYPSAEGICIFFSDVTEQRRQREELRASLERFELVMQVTRDVIYDWNIEGRRIQWNQNYYSVFEYDFAEPEEDVILWERHLHPDDRKNVVEGLKKALTGTAHFWEAEYRFERGDGSYADVFDRGYIVRNEARSAVRMVGAMVDVSVQKERNRALHETTRRVTTILESITDGFFSLDREWRFTYINEQAERLLKKPREQLMGRNVWEEFPQAVGSKFELEYRRAVRERVTVKFEAYYDALEVWLYVVAYPSPDGLSVYFHDVTDRKRSEEALRVSEEFSHRVIESSSDCIKILDLEGRLLGMTVGGQRLMEITDLRPWLGKLWVDFWKNDHYEEAQNALATARAGGVGRFQGACPTMAGKMKYWDVICTAIRGADGTPEKVLSVSRDITDLRRAEEERRTIEARKEAIVNSALDAILTIDSESRVHDWNPTAERMFGYRREEVLGRSMVELIIAPEWREQHRERMRRAVAKRNSRLQRRYELAARRADGRTFPAEISIAQISTEGEPLFTGFVRDISERKRAETLLRQQEENLRLIVDGAQDYAIFTLDLMGRITSWNSGAEHIFGYARSEILGQSGAILFTPEDLAAREDEKEIETASDSGVAADERWHVRKGGERFWASGQMRGLKDDRGRVRSFLKILRDDTVRRRARDEIERLNAELEERVERRTAELEAANRELEAFSYSVSHDLKAPLRHIKAFGAMLEETTTSKLDTEEKHYLNSMTRSAEKMSLLIDDLLAFSRILRVELILKEVSLQELVEQTIGNFAVDMRDRRVDLRVGTLPTVQGDAAMLRQVLANLFSNALKYTRSREVAEIEIGSRENENEFVVFVKDNGVGFDPKKADKLFGVFQRLHDEREFEGTGVGLANVRRIIERHEGRVWAESDPGKGATFYVSLPKRASER